ncbi:MAG: VWA domain-containing protein [Myxococcales bacterium]|nr:VWA domain-containing protein [Myxococcales bacterium]
MACGRIGVVLGGLMLALGCAPTGAAGPGRSGDPSDRGGADAGPTGPIPGADAAPPSGFFCPGHTGTLADCDDPVASETLQNLDSDSDGLSDYEEICVYFTDPCLVDTDGDGLSDLVEVAAGTDPNDASSRIPEEDFAVVLPYHGDRVARTLLFSTAITIADLYFLIDTTGSMSGPINNVRSSLGMIAARVQERIPDVQMGVGRFDDFPFGGYGGSADQAYANVQDITADLAAVQAGLNTLSASGGADIPESQVEAIFQTATGLGGTWTHSGSTYSIPPRSCPAIPDEPSARRGYPCFRPGALPIVVLVSDATWHNNEAGGFAYSGINPPPATFDQAAAALSSIGGRFIGVMTGAQGGGPSYRAMATRTGSVDGAGNPLVYTASDGTVSTEIVNGIETIIGATPQDVSTRTANVPGNPDDFDATTFIKAIRPVQGYRDGIPGAGFASMDDTTFYGVIPGTLVEFTVDFWNDVRAPAERAQVFRARIFVVGNGVADLDQREVYIVVPPDGGPILI